MGGVRTYPRGCYPARQARDDTKEWGNSMKYFVSYQNGAFAVFEWMGDLADDEQLDDLLEAAYQAAPGSLCHQCAENFEISDDAEVREIREEESHKMVFEEPT